MNRLKNISLVLASLVGIFYGVGFILPRNERETARTRLVAVPSKIYAVVADVESWPDWHPEVADVRELDRIKDKPMWRITTRSGLTYELEISLADEGVSWQGMYTTEDSSHILRFNFGWYGEGGRVHLTTSADTRNRWRRARLFFTPRKHAAPNQILRALATQLGESAVIEK